MGTESNQEEASNSSSHSRTTTSSQSEIFYSYNNRSDFSTSTPSQSEIFSHYDANSESNSRETSRPSSPESGNLTVRTLYSPLPKMAIVHRSMHDAIHAVREQHSRAVTRGLLTQQKALAANKLQCNAQFKRTSTPDPPMSNVPPRQARTRLEETNGVTSGSSEESDCEPQTASKARFEALKRQFKAPTKTEEETPSHGVPVKRQRLFCTPSSKSATSCPPASNASGPSQRRSSGTASEGD